jgi:hypothetical protein
MRTSTPRKAVRTWLPWLALGLALAMFALSADPAQAKKTDVIVLENGDHITGEIKKLERGQLKYSTDDMGTVYVEWGHVEAIWSMNEHRVRLEDGTFYYGPLAEPRESLTVVVIVAPGDSIPLERKDIVGITPIHSTFWDRMDGSLSLGFNYTQSTDIGQLTFNYRNSYQASLNYLELNWVLNMTSQKQEEPSRYQDFSITYERETKKRLYVSGSVGFEQNDELGIALRVPATTGMGRRIVQTNNVLFTGLVGLSVNAEQSTSTDSVTVNLEGVLNTGFQFFRYDSPKSDISSGLTLYPSLSNWGRVRLNFNISLQHELISDFFVDLTFWDNYDTDPPSEDAQQNDWAITTSIGWKY